MKTAYLKFDHGVESVEKWTSLIAMLVISALMILKVFFRYVLQEGLSWNEEALAVCMLVLVNFGSAYAIRIGSHADMQGLVDYIPAPVRYVLKFFVNLLAFVFLVFYTYISIAYAGRTAMKYTTPLLKIPLRIEYYFMVIGGVLMVYEYIKVFKGRVFARPEHEVLAEKEGKING